jgi:hypothetical protein
LEFFEPVRGIKSRSAAFNDGMMMGDFGRVHWCW